MFKVLIICAIFAIPPILEARADIKKIANECIKELGIKTNDEGRPDKYDAEMKCFAKCVALKSGLMDANGAMVEANVPKKIRVEAKECFAKVTDTDLCKKANAVSKCIFSAMKGKTE